MDEIINDNILDNEPVNSEPANSEPVDTEPVSSATVTDSTIDATPADDATADSAVPGNAPAKPVSPAPIDPRYAGYADNSNVTWNGSSYSGRPVQDSVNTQPNYANVQPAPTTGYSQAYNSYSSGATYTQDSMGAYTQGYGYARNYRFVSEPVMKQEVKKKKGMPKAVAVILLAVLFGVVASGVFIGANALFYKLNPDTAPAPVLGGNEISNPSSDKPAKDSVQPIQNNPGLVSSTDIISDVNMSATDVSAVVDSAMPSIVSIDCTFNTTSFFGVYETAGAGSGIILKQTADELLVATNNHVVANATSINVTFDDGTTAPATTKGTDSVADLAVVSVSIKDLADETLEKLKVATIGDSDAIKVGQMVVAIGNAMGYGQSTTVGYVSAKDREVEVEGNTMTLLQTDAAINPGNSGGALLNLKGEVIGINSVKYADNDVEGMGFAIPISRAIAILDELANREILKEEEKGYLGVYLRDVTTDMADYYNMPYGVYVIEVTEGCAAEAAGLQTGDVITAVNGREVLTSTDLKNEVTAHRVGTTISITFKRLQRGVYNEYTVDVVLGRNPELAE